MVIASTVLGDVITLKSGEKISGEVVTQTETYISIKIANEKGTCYFIENYDKTNVVEISIDTPEKKAEREKALEDARIAESKKRAEEAEELARNPQKRLNWLQAQKERVQRNLNDKQALYQEIASKIPTLQDTQVPQYAIRVIAPGYYAHPGGNQALWVEAQTERYISGYTTVPNSQRITSQNNLSQAQNDVNSLRQQLGQLDNQIQSTMREVANKSPVIVTKPTIALNDLNNKTIGNQESNTQKTEIAPIMNDNAATKAIIGIVGIIALIAIYRMIK